MIDGQSYFERLDAQERAVDDPEMNRAGRNIAFALGLVAALRCYHSGHDDGRPVALVAAGLWHAKTHRSRG